MIRINKSVKPAILVKNEARWNRDLMKHFHDTGKLHKGYSKRYRHKKIKQAIVDETNGKCAYCESQISHIYFGDIEHIVPKSKFPRLAFTWSNLTLGCYICNNNKHDFMDRSCMLLNPVKDTISDHIVAVGDRLFHRTDRGYLTIKTLELNRNKLRDKRTEKMEMLALLIEKHNSSRIDSVRRIIKNEINEYVNSEYTFILEDVRTKLMIA